MAEYEIRETVPVGEPHPQTGSCDENLAVAGHTNRDIDRMGAKFFSFTWRNCFNTAKLLVTRNTAGAIVQLRVHWYVGRTTMFTLLAD